MLSREERIFGELLVARGLVARDLLGRVALEPAADLEHALSISGVEPAVARSVRDEARAIDRALETTLREGARLGDFRIVREIGRGGMGVVFEAEQEGLGRRVALKVLSAGAALDERRVTRFLREARSAGRLQHPGIVSVFASGRDEGTLFFAMELVEGPSVAEVLRQGPLEPAHAARLIAEVARAVDHAHGCGLVHRDIKPENILLSPDGRPRLTDFGLVHDVASESCTLSHFVLGTPAYVAPEQALGEPVDRRVDVYGLGAVLYTLLSGRPPYLGDVPSAVLARLLEGPPAPLLSLKPELPRALVAICERAMAREPQARHDGAATLAGELESYLRGERPAADLAPRRPRWGWAGMLAALAGGIAVTVLLLTQRAPSRPVAEVAPAAPTWRIVSTSGDRAAPSLSYDGNRVVHCEKSDRWFRVVLLDVDTLERTDLSGPLAQKACGALSRDGRRVAYSSASSLYFVDLERRTTEQLSAPVGVPVWSPDGRELFFTEVGGPTAGVILGKLWVVDAFSGEVRHRRSMDARGAAYSPNGLRVAFGSMVQGQVDIWSTRPDGSDPVPLTQDPEVDWSPAWTPDGGRILFGSARGGLPGLWSRGVDEVSGSPRGEPRPALPTVFAAPFFMSVSGDGKRLAITSTDEPGRLVRFSLDPASGTLSTPPAALPRHPTAVRSPDSSPDGRSLVFTAHSQDEDIAILAVDGNTAPVFLTADNHSDRAPRWSPDGTTIAFESNRSGKWEIWTILRDGGDLRQITDTPGGDAVSPVWSPDGARIAYAVAGAGLFAISSTAQRGDPRPESLEASGSERIPFEPSSWSSDGSILAGSAGGVVLYSLSTRGYRRLTSFGERPAWVPDGRSLLFTTERAVWIVDRGGEPREVYSAAPCGVSPGLGISGNGRDVHASLTASSAELWVTELPSGLESDLDAAQARTDSR